MHHKTNVGSRLMRPFLALAAIVLCAQAIELMAIWFAIGDARPAAPGRIAAVFALSSMLLIAAIVIFGHRCANAISLPLDALCAATREVEKGNFSARARIQTGDELEELGALLDKAIGELEKTEKERAQFEKSKTEFLSITSHELRSPMTAMKAQLQMLGKGYFGKLSAKQRESVEIVLRNTERLDTIIVDLLEVSRIEAARLRFTFERAPMRPHIERLLEEMRLLSDKKRIAIVAEIGHLPLIEADNNRVMQVLRNLLNNAIKFSFEGGKIVVRAHAIRDAILVSVQDSGIGIPDEKKGRIFEPFYQVEDPFSREHGGTGLGLTICRGIVESQKGRIWFESREGKGTTFYFTVPLEPVRQTQPIRLLFSQSQYKENQLLSLFNEVLGPLGVAEFASLAHKMDERELHAYVDSLREGGVIEKPVAEGFKRRIRAILDPGRGKREGMEGKA